jgi:hypothetical protein
MNRKLHNTTSALLASAGLLVLALVAGSPAPAPSAAESFAGSVEATPAAAGLVLASEAATMAVLAEALDPADASAAGGDAGSVAPRKPRRRHQSVAMPFFSFAPRG